jgi:hypothetical protein
MARLLAFLTLFAVCACEQQSPYAYSQYSPYEQTYPYQQSSGWQRNRPPPASSYAGGQRQQGPAGAPQAQLWNYPDGTSKWGVYDPNTGTMK